jgi:hypothetical protein
VEYKKRSERVKNSDRLQSGIEKTVRKRDEFGPFAERNTRNCPKE